MAIANQALLLSFLYKIASLMVGLLVIRMGYKLFMNGIWGNAGEINASFQDKKLIIRRAAPGTFFSMAGFAIICITLVSGFKINTTHENNLTSTKDNSIDSKIEPLTLKNTLPEDKP